MIGVRNWAHQLAEGSAVITLNLLEQALLSDTLRGVVMKEVTKHILTRKDTFLDPRRPAQVQQDKQDIMRALIHSFQRALDRKQISRGVLHTLLRSAFANYVNEMQDEESKDAGARFALKHGGQKPPGLMVISPTRTCNLRCTGCYASAGPSGERLDWDVFDRIITEAKKLWGMRFFVISGGEPFTYRSHGKSLLDMVKKHHDCFFLSYTNGTLIDARMAARIAEAGNLTPAISVEGFEKLTDQRRGPGVFQSVLDAMGHLRQAGVPFGVSLTATRENAEELLSDAFIDFFFEQQQAMYGWLFQYMPIGKAYTLDLLVTPQQRLWMWRRTWQLIRERQILLADFWNCGTTSEGCIAACAPVGYFYIDWNGKIMPCVFVPYSAANIHDIYRQGGTLDDVYELPYFQAIRQWQWEYGLGKQRPEEHGNWLLPCSIRDHYAMGRGLIDAFHAEPEDAAASEALQDGRYYDAMVQYDRELRGLFDPIWKAEYLKQVPIVRSSENESLTDLPGSSRHVLEFQARPPVPREEVGVSAAGPADGFGPAAQDLGEASGGRERSPHEGFRPRLGGRGDVQQHAGARAFAPARPQARQGPGFADRGGRAHRRDGDSPFGRR
jgi:MoaA/NifB/PqqE/SkfB family radical SAM enzyme